MMDARSIQNTFCQAIVKPFLLFCVSGGSYLDLGLSCEQLLCLYNECLCVAKYHREYELCIMVCRLAVDKNRILGKNDNVLRYAKEILGYANELESDLVQLYEMFAHLLIGGTYAQLNEIESAITHLKKGAELSQSIDLKEIEFYANTLLMWAYESLNQHEEAIPYIVRLNEIAEELNDNHKLVNGYAKLAGIYDKLKQFNQAMMYGKKIIHIAKEINLNDGLLEAYSFLIKWCLMLKRNDEVISYTREYINVAQTKQVHPEGGPEGNSVFVLADLLDNPEQYDDAVIDGQQCYKISVEVDVYVWWVLSNLGQAYLHLGHEEKALFYFEQVIKLIKQQDESLENSDSLEFLECALHKAGIAHLLRSHYATAHDYFSKSLEIAEELKHSTEIAVLSSQISQMNAFFGVYNSCDRHLSEQSDGVEGRSDAFNQFNEGFETARKYELNQEYVLALSCYKKLKILSDGSLIFPIRMQIAKINLCLKRVDIALSLYQEICEEAQSRGHTKVEAECQHWIGYIHLSRFDLTNAENCARKSIECFEKVFDLQRTNEEYHIAIVDMFIRCYDLLILILLKSKRWFEALDTLDRYRARALKSQLVMNYQMDQDTLEEPIQFGYTESLVSNGKYAIVQYLASRGFEDISLLTFLLPCENERRLLRCQLNFTVEHMKTLIERAFNEINVRDLNCENRSLNFDTETDEVEENSEGSCREVTIELGRDLYSTLASEEEKPSEANNDESCINSALEILYSKLIHNVISDIVTDEIVFIPDGPLFKVPFAALRNPETGLYLSETKRIRISPSISTLKVLDDRPADFESKSSVLIVGDPSVGKVMLNGKEKEFPPLLFSYVEAVTVSRALGGQTLLRDKATKAAVLEKLRQGVSVVHIAAHGDGKKGTIALAPSPNASRIPEEDDYMLTMADVQKANVRAKLVVLSCCHSGRGEIKAEGVVGMCRAFLASGARAVVASLWAIDDEATLEFMKVFYSNLKEKKSASLSLQLAMKHMMKHKEFHEVKYWAPFYLMGDDVTIF